MRNLRETKKKMNEIQRTILKADRDGYRLEFVGGLGVWEASPVLRHQKKVDEIRASLRPANAVNPCLCVHYADIQVAFPDGSQKRPDIAVFCREPDEQDTAVTLLPEAVIEILSKNYEAKDLEIGVPFYRHWGIKDIVVFDPETGGVNHYQGAMPAQTHQSPVTLSLQCGCVCTV